MKTTWYIARLIYAESIGILTVQEEKELDDWTNQDPANRMAIRIIESAQFKSRKKLINDAHFSYLFPDKFPVQPEHLPFHERWRELGLFPD